MNAELTENMESYSILADSNNAVSVFAVIGALSLIYYGSTRAYKILFSENDFQPIEEHEI